MTQSAPKMQARLDPVPSCDADIRAHLGRELRVLYGDPAEEKLPFKLSRLLDRVAQVIRAHTEPVDQAFVDGIMSSEASLRFYAVSLTHDINRAGDLVQETVLKAISKQERFEPGTTPQAWLFTIPRNIFFSDRRRTQRKTEDADGAFAASMVSMPDHEDRLAVQDLHAALAKLPKEQRETLLLVGAEGLSYEETAEAMGAKVGTIKSRVNRAWNRLAELLDLAQEDGIASSHGTQA